MVFLKQRPILLTVWLILLIASYAAAALESLFIIFIFKVSSSFESPLSNSSRFLSRAGVILFVASLLLVFFLAALLKWKKWGFYGFTTVFVVYFIFAMGVIFSLSGSLKIDSWIDLGFAFLLGPAGQIGTTLLLLKKTKTWSQLE